MQMIEIWRNIADGKLPSLDYLVGSEHLIEPQFNLMWYIREHLRRDWKTGEPEHYSSKLQRAIFYDLLAILEEEGNIVLEDVDELFQDFQLIDQFAAKMKAKLEKGMYKGRGGWRTCNHYHLNQLMNEHISKGDPVDVANYCMMLNHLHYRTHWVHPLNQPKITIRMEHGE